LTCSAALATLILAGALSPAHAAFVVDGRSFAIYVDMPNVGINDQYYVDTGWLPPSGGEAAASAASLQVTNLLDTGPLGSGSRGDDCRGDSDFSIGNSVLLPGDPAQITFTTMWGRDDDECCDDEDSPHAVTIEGLTFGGQPIPVTGALNQIVTIPGVGVLTINEYGHGHGGGGHGGGGHGDDDDDECEDDEDHWVNGLHLVMDGGGEVVVGSAYFHSHDHCCPVKTQASTWGSVKALFRMSE
jgi:hypothetical protein